MLDNVLWVVTILALIASLFHFFRKRKLKKDLKSLTPFEIEILKYLRDNQPCTEEKLRKHFCGDKGKE